MTRIQSRSVLVAILVVVCVGLLVLNQLGYLTAARGALLVPFTTLQRSLAGVVAGIAALRPSDAEAEALRQRNTQLEARIAELEGRIVTLQEQVTDMGILSALLDYARSEPERHYVAANVISRDSSPFLNYIVIDLGTDDGVRRDMPVVTHQGLVGRVTESSCCAAKVQLIIDPTSAVNARLQASRDEGVVVGQLAGGLELQYLSQQAQVNPGDLVLTSGLAGTFPEGIPIGTVSAVQRLDYEVLQKAILTPGVDFARLEIVLVITNFAPADLSPFLPATPAPGP
jgi:rod shape-determining protein MreC